MPVDTNTMSYAIVQVATGQKQSRIPIWVMRQAGRYLPEFLELRKKYDFFTIVNTPSLAAEVTMMPIRRFDLDAAIIFSDILVVPQAVGMEVSMEAGIGPVLPNPISVPSDLFKLNFKVDVKEAMKGTLQAIAETRILLQEREVALIGFSGAPWTLMSYMIEGGGSRTLSKAKAWLYRHPEESVNFLNGLTEVVVNYLVEQVLRGAQLLQVFESHAENLSPHLFKKYCIPTLEEISKQVKARLTELGVKPVPMIIFAKGGHFALKEISSLGYDVVGIDWTMDPKVAREIVGPDVVLQGKLDPCALYAPQVIILISIECSG